MSTTIGKAPGGAKFIASAVAAARDLALAFSGEPDDQVLAHLERGREGLTRRLTSKLGADTAAAVVDALIRATMAEKRRLESLTQWQA